MRLKCKGFLPESTTHARPQSIRRKRTKTKLSLHNNLPWISVVLWMWDASEPGNGQLTSVRKTSCKYIHFLLFQFGKTINADIPAAQREATRALCQNIEKTFIIDLKCLWNPRRMYTMEPIRSENGPTRTVEFTVHDDLLLFALFVLQTGNIYKYIYT